MDAQETIERAAVVAEAHEWLGTPWHHRARVKGQGVDCGQLIGEIFTACGLVDAFDTGDYSMQHHLHRSDELVKGWVERFAGPVETPLPGDLVLFKFGRCFSHLGLVVAWPTIIHAYRWTCVELADATKAPFLDRATDRPLETCFYSYWSRS